MTFFIVPIVEGQTENRCVERLLHRIWTELLASPVRLQVLLPSRANRDKLLNPTSTELANKVEEAFAKLSQRLCRDRQARGLLLLLLDAERDCPKELGPKLLAKARQARSDVDVVCVLAKRMLEHWIVAGASTLAGINGLPYDLSSRDQFEERSGAAWLEGQLRMRNPRRKYKKTVDAEQFIKAMNVSECLANCPSFAKLCKELQIRVQKIAAAGEVDSATLSPPLPGTTVDPPP
jgi:Domain of unknown function (DUF4276)